MKYLLDANVFSTLLLPAVPAALVSRFEERRADLATASIVVHELRFGADLLPARSKRRMAILDFIRTHVESMPILPYETNAASWHATERARLCKLGRTPPFADGQIAAIAATNGLALVTANTRDFAAYRGLRVERW